MKRHAEQNRIKAHYQNKENWLKWGPYLSERQWGTVREDDGKENTPWASFPFEEATKRAYRWGEDGIAGISDEHQYLCFSIALWNGKDPILKERLFGLNKEEASKEENVKELYYYLANTPSHSYMNYLYKYPISEFPYKKIRETSITTENQLNEHHIADTGIFNDQKYCDISVEYAKETPEDIFIKITVHNHSEELTKLHLLPTLWFRNMWSTKEIKEKPLIKLLPNGQMHSSVETTHYHLGANYLYFEPPTEYLFTENESSPADSIYTKDLFHKAIIQNDFNYFESKKYGTKFAPLYKLQIAPKEKQTIRLRLSRKKNLAQPFHEFNKLFETRIEETDSFYQQLAPSHMPDLKNMMQQALSGLLWNKQFYYLNMSQWLDQNTLPEEPSTKRNKEWSAFFSQHIISTPDKWSYPWFNATELAFQSIPLAIIDPEGAKDQLLLLLNECYMKANGQLPANEWNFSARTPPLHAWACLKVFNLNQQKEHRDIDFLKKAFMKLMLHFNWWTNQKDANGQTILEGGCFFTDFPAMVDLEHIQNNGLQIKQVESTGWMAMYCANMIEMALEISMHETGYEEIAIKFVEHFIYLSDTLQQLINQWQGLWDEQEGFFFPIATQKDAGHLPLKIKTINGIIPLFSATIIKKEHLTQLKGFRERFEQLKKHRAANGKTLPIAQKKDEDTLLSLLPKEHFIKITQQLLDENEFLSPSGIRSLSKKQSLPYSFSFNNKQYHIPSQKGNTPSYSQQNKVWVSINYLIIDTLKSYHQYYKEQLLFKFPGKEQNYLNLEDIANILSYRLINLFIPDEFGHRAIHGKQADLYTKKDFNDLLQFHEWYHGNYGRGMGASHFTGSTALIAELIQQLPPSKE